LWNWFASVDTDRSDAIHPNKLERALINGDWIPFNLDTVKLLMTSFDTDRTIGFNEYGACLRFLPSLNFLPLRNDVMRIAFLSRGGVVRTPSARPIALLSAPFTSRPLHFRRTPAHSDIKAGCSAPAHATHAPAGISFDRFVLACVVVKQLSEAFGRLDTDRDGWIQIGYEGFMENVLSLP
ncbi:hypothetical protein B0H19DRAFT_920135, partial [Mycena capillaripes]